MNPKRQLAILALCDKHAEALKTATVKQAALDKAKQIIDQQLRKFPYLRPGEYDQTAPQVFALICQHPYGKEQGWVEDLAPQMEELTRIRCEARDGWERERAAGEAVDEVEKAVQDIFSAEFNERIEMVLSYARRVLAPLCPDDDDLQRTVRDLPYYNALLINRARAHNSKHTTERIRRMFIELAKLAESKGHDLATFQQP